MKPIHLAGLLPLLVAAQAATLFEDTFDRADSRNIQETLDGIDHQTGTAFEAGGDPGGTPVYFHGHLDPNSGYPGFGAPDTNAANGASARILDNTLELAAEQAGTSNAIINHNFTGASILAAGGFSVSLDVHARGATENGNGGGFALGMSLAEALATRDAFSGNPRLTGGLGTNIGAGNAVPAQVASDFWIVLRANGSLAWGGAAGTMGIFGVPAGQGIPNNPFGTITVNFFLDDFDAGSAVNYEVFYNGEPRGEGSFTWSGANENYIGLEGRNGTGVNLDNLRIATDFIGTPLFPPMADAFEVTRLSGTGDTRFHWRTTEGTIGDPVTITIRNGATIVHTSNTPDGFADVNTGGATAFTLTASNATGDSETLDATLTADDGFAAEVRADAPVAWYRFNETFGSRLIADSAGNAAPHDGDVLGGVTTGGPGPRDGAAFFPGGGSILADPIFDPAALENGHTIETIVQRLPGANVNAAIVSQIDGTGTGRSHLAVNNDGTIQTFLAGGAPQRKDADVKLPPNTWAHLAMVVDKSVPEIRFYLDGALIGSTTDGANPDGSTFNPDFTIESATGAWRIGTQKLANQNFWLGDMDEVVIYDKVLAAGRIAAHAAAWLEDASGLLGFSASSETIAPGGSTMLTVKTGGDVTSVEIDNGIGTVAPVNGVVTIPVSPSATTTYTVTVESPAGTQTLTVTITVTAPPVPPVIVSGVITGTDFHLTFTGAPSTTYRVRGSLDLQSFPLDHGTATTDAAGLGEALVPLVSGQGVHFYRVEEIPAP